ncbi:uncharacterized protein LOC143238945 [Tachypleus tridentatus]|uniref:uncharacterized protein LOC143238945 n=1 Tax=Tachypleus tridentatus TaxID=6853 RepID=UPI003FD51AB7
MNRKHEFSLLTRRQQNFVSRRIRLPDGFIILLEDVTREILRHQPPDISSFAAAYFEGLLRKREQWVRTDKSDASKVVSSNSTEGEVTAIKTQSMYRGYIVQKHCNVQSKPQDTQDVVNVYTSASEPVGKETRILDMNNEKLETNRSQNIDPEEEETLQLAATKIQASFRGHKVRKNLEVNKPAYNSLKYTSNEANNNLQNGRYSVEGDKYDNLTKDIVDNELEGAAIKLQAQFRGYKARKSIRNHEQNHTLSTSEHAAVQMTEKHPEKTVTSMENDADLFQATIKIQPSFRENDEHSSQVESELTDQTVNSPVNIKVSHSEKVERLNESEKTLDRNGINQTVEEMKNEYSETMLIRNNSVDERERKCLKTLTESKDLMELEGSATNETNESLTMSFQNGLPEDKEIENAAVKIQANFRGHLARKQLYTSDIQQKQDSFQKGNVTPNEKNENSTFSSLNGLTEEKEMENAAVKIQANFRGHLARKQLHTSDIQQKQDSFQEVYVTPNENNENSTFSSLNGLTEDKEMENAAVKIQANFRGHLARKQLHTSDIQQKQDSFQELNVTPSEKNENSTFSSLNGLTEEKEMENAAVKIQANFRGHLARKQLHTSDIQQKQDSFQEVYVTPNENNENSTFSSLNGLTEDKEMENAAVKIQANFRGHLARKQLHTSDIQQKQDSFQELNVTPSEKNENSTFSSLNGLTEEKEMENAAVKIQANFRGHLARKQLHTSDIQQKQDSFQELNVTPSEKNENSTLAL